MKLVTHITTESYNNHEYVTQYTIHSDVMLNEVNASETLVNKVKVSE